LPLFISVVAGANFRRNIAVYCDHVLLLGRVVDNPHRIYLAPIDLTRLLGVLEARELPRLIPSCRKYDSREGFPYGQNCDST